MDRPRPAADTFHPRPHDSFALVRVPVKTAAEACVYARMPAGALALLDREQTPRQYLDALLLRELFPEAARFLAFALPRREAVWWSCLCVRLAQPALPPAEEQALHAAVLWVVEPSEPHRLAAERLANEQSAAGYAARAVAWTGGSLNPPSLPAVPPGPDLSHHAVVAAVSLAAGAVPPQKSKEFQRHALALGIHVARGKHLWAHPAHGAHPHPR